MKNDNSILALRSNALINIGIIVAIILCSWFLYGLLSKSGIQKKVLIKEIQHELGLLKKEGVITKKVWDSLSPEEKKQERWQTQIKLVPTLQKLIGIGTPQSSKNLVTLKNISQNTGKSDYIDWLNASWTQEFQGTLAQTQTDIAEIIPVFAGISDSHGTEIISGKITLKTLIDYIQTNIIEKFNLGDALGLIGINSVQFLEDAGDIGIYDVPLRFEGVPNTNIMELLKFIKKTGDVRIIEDDKNIRIEHKINAPLKKTGTNESTLKNLLITVKELVIIPSGKDEKNPNNEIMTKQSLWDVNITLQFYIRGASRDHIATLDRTITARLDKNNSQSLVTKGNDLLKVCNNCPEASTIKDILSLLGNAQNAYTSILAQEKNPKNTFTPIQILEHRTKLLSTIESLSIKLNRISGIIPQ